MLLLRFTKADVAFPKLSESTTKDSTIPPKLSVQYGSLTVSAPINDTKTVKLVNPSARWWAALEVSTEEL